MRLAAEADPSTLEHATTAGREAYAAVVEEKRLAAEKKQKALDIEVTLYLEARKEAREKQRAAERKAAGLSDSDDAFSDTTEEEQEDADDADDDGDKGALAKAREAAVDAEGEASPETRSYSAALAGNAFVAGYVDGGPARSAPSCLLLDEHNDTCYLSIRHEIRKLSLGPADDSPQDEGATLSATRRVETSGL